MNIGRGYLAAPFFTPEQLAFVKEIEWVLDEYQIDYFSPRLEGTIIEMEPEEKKRRMDSIYEKNVVEIKASHFMIAVIDGRDQGTIFEVGYFRGSASYGWRAGLPHYIITITNEGHGVNVMLRNSTDAHLYGIKDLRKMLAIAKATNDLRLAMDSFQCKEENVT